MGREPGMQWEDPESKNVHSAKIKEVAKANETAAFSLKAQEYIRIEKDSSPRMTQSY